MRLLLITERYAPEARSNAHIFQDLAEGLADMGHDVVVLAKRPDDYIPGGNRGPGRALPEDSFENGVRVFRIPECFGPTQPIVLRAFDQMIFGFRVVWRMMRIGRPDRIIVYTPPLPLAGIVAAYARSRGISLVLNLHDLYPRTPIELGVLKNPLLIGLAKILESHCYRSASDFLVPSPGSRRYLIEERRIPEENVHLVFNWVDTKSVRPGRRENAFRKAHDLSNYFVVSYAGIMGYAQDLSSTIACAKRMVAHKDIVFLLVGEGVYRERWQREAAGLPNVRFFPNLDRTTYLDLLRASDVCLAPLTAELLSPAIPGKVQNIMAVGRAVVAIVPEKSEAARIIRESEAGFVVPPSDSGKLMALLLMLYADRSRLEVTGALGRRFAEDNFELKRALRRIDAMLQGRLRKDLVSGGVK